MLRPHHIAEDRVLREAASRKVVKKSDRVSVEALMSVSEVAVTFYHSASAFPSPAHAYPAQPRQGIKLYVIMLHVVMIFSHFLLFSRLLPQVACLHCVREQFCFPPEEIHPRSTGRLIVFGLYGPFNEEGQLTCGFRGSHVVSSFELESMIDDVDTDDIVSVYVVRAVDGTIASICACLIPESQ